MTAEVAIINRSAVTLAADSAVTMTIGGAEKIYPSADKLFELSTSDPLGVMIFNNLEFMGVPLDLAIKQFRTSKHCCRFARAVDAPAAFFDYLAQVWCPSEELQIKHVQQLVRPVLRKVRGEFMRRVSETTFTKKSPNPYTFFLEVLTYEAESYRRENPAECFADLGPEALADRYREAILQVIEAVFPHPPYPLSEKDKAGLVDLCALVLHRDVLSEDFTGLVFAGFGADEMFPLSARL